MSWDEMVWIAAAMASSKASLVLAAAALRAALSLEKAFSIGEKSGE